nr:ABC transporter substrate-binding protein [Nakamurella flavida]
MTSSKARAAAVASLAAGGLLLAGCGGSATPAAGSASSALSSAVASETSAAASSGSASSSAATAATSGSATSGSAASGSGVAAADVEAAKASLISAGSLTVCTHLPYAPFESNDDAGETVGFDIDMMKLVATELGVEVAVVDTPFEGIKSGQDMSTGKCDIAAAGMTINDERSKVILFSEPYFDATQALLVRSGDSYASLDDLSGKRVGAQSSTTGLDYANANAAESGYEVVEFQDLASEQQALVTNQIDGAINDLPVWSEYIKEQAGTTKIAAQFDTGEQYGFGMKLDNTPLKSVVDATISKAQSDGTYDELYTQWIGEVPAG